MGLLLSILPCDGWYEGIDEAFGREKAAGGGMAPLDARGGNPFGELRLRILLATSQSSHERDIGNAPSSSDSIGEADEPPRQWLEGPPPAMAIGAEALALWARALPMNPEATAADPPKAPPLPPKPNECAEDSAGVERGGGNAAAPFSYRAST